MNGRRLDFSLPEPVHARPRGAWIQWVTMLVAVATLTTLVVMGGSRRRPGADEGTVSRLRELAEGLERKTLYVEAEEVWAEVQDASRPEGEELARILYRRGKCLKEGGRYGEAVRRLIEARDLIEARGMKSLEGMARQAGIMTLECYAALGKHAVRDEALKALAMLGGEEVGGVVARIGNDEITAADLRAEIEREARVRVSMGPGPRTGDDVEKAVAEEVSRHMADPQRLRRTLEGMIAGRMLYVEALERKLHEGEDLQRAMDDFRRQYLAGKVVESYLKDEMKISETDLANHYAAHRKDYVEPKAIRFSRISFEDRESVDGVLKKGPEEVRRLPFVEVDEWLGRSDPIPDIGPDPEISAHLFAMEKGEVSDRAFEREGKLHLFRIDDIRPERELSLDEARERVRADLLQAKQLEAMQALQKRLAQKFKVEILEDKLKEMSGAKPEEKADEPSETKGS